MKNSLILDLFWIDQVQRTCSHSAYSQVSPSQRTFYITFIDNVPINYLHLCLYTINFSLRNWIVAKKKTCVSKKKKQKRRLLYYKNLTRYHIPPIFFCNNDFDYSLVWEKKTIEIVITWISFIHFQSLLTFKLNPNLKFKVYKYKCHRKSHFLFFSSRQLLNDLLGQYMCPYIELFLDLILNA